MSTNRLSAQVNALMYDILNYMELINYTTPKLIKLTTLKGDPVILAAPTMHW